MKHKNLSLCKSLRKNCTDAERKLWAVLRNRQILNIKFRRQHNIGNYILDFYAPCYKLGIEADGGQHYNKSGKHKDRIRDAWLKSQGIKILRFNDIDILTNIDGVSEIIKEEIEAHTPSPFILSPLGRGKRRETCDY